jgi:glycine/D-amino acid oxidase-like deaminating enzyme
MTETARVAVIGGGIMGASLLYHLARAGWTDVALLERGELAAGSTWHAAGNTPHFNTSLNLSRIHLASTELYSGSRPRPDRRWASTGPAASGSRRCRTGWTSTSATGARRGRSASRSR